MLGVDVEILWFDANCHDLRSNCHDVMCGRQPIGFATKISISDSSQSALQIFEMIVADFHTCSQMLIY